MILVATTGGHLRPGDGSALAPVLLPIPGASRPASLLDSAAAADLELTDDEVATLSEDD